MNLRDFQERVRALRFVDFDQFEAAGVSAPEVHWGAFMSNPSYWLTIAEDAEAQKVWDYLEGRLPPGELASPPTPWWDVFHVMRDFVHEDAIVSLHRTMSEKAARRGDEGALQELNVARDEALAAIRARKTAPSAPAAISR